jgi:hypothetical protein
MSGEPSQLCGGVRGEGGQALSLLRLEPALAQQSAAAPQEHAHQLEVA